MRVESVHAEPVHVPVGTLVDAVDPTGVGDAFRAGFLSGIAWGLSAERSAQLGCLLASYVIETIGTQEYDLGSNDFLTRLARAYGDDAATDVQPHLQTLHA